MIFDLDKRIDRLASQPTVANVACEVGKNRLVRRAGAHAGRVLKNARTFFNANSIDEIFRDPERFVDRRIKGWSADALKKSMYSDIRFSLNRFLHHMNELAGLKFSGTYVRSDAASFSAETDRTSGTITPDRMMGFYDGLLSLDAPKFLDLPYTDRLEIPLMHRGVRYGATVFEKRNLRRQDKALLIYCTAWLGQHLDNSLQAYAWRRAALEDHLTGLYNRRHFDARIARLVKKAQKTGRPLSVIELDLDHFKEINDNHGHAEGDAALRAVAGLLRRNFRAEDIARYGGEEFAITLENTPYHVAKERAEQLLVDFTGLEFPEKITATMGVASTAGDPGSDGDTDSHSAIELLRIADQRLYDAKTFRNAVYCLDDDPLTGLPNVRYVRDELRKYLDTERRRNHSVALFIYNVRGMNHAIRRYGQEPAWNLFREAVLCLNGENPEFEAYARVHRRDEVIGLFHSRRNGRSFEKGVQTKAEQTLLKLRTAAPLDFVLGVVIYSQGAVDNYYAMRIAEDPSILMSSAQKVVDDAKRHGLRLLVRPYSG